MEAGGVEGVDNQLLPPTELVEWGVSGDSIALLFCEYVFRETSVLGFSIGFSAINGACLVQ